MDRCPHTCHFITGIDNNIEPPPSYEETEEKISFEGDQLFVLDIDKYLQMNSITINYVKQSINCTNYDYVLKCNPECAKAQDWQEIVPEQYHDYQDRFTKEDFDKLPEQCP